ncbi:MAG: hypothetical protein WCG80_16480 [Spirochaetales bacterium]
MVQLQWFPEKVAGKRGGYVGEFLNKSTRRRPDLVACVEAFLSKLSLMDRVDTLFDSQQLASLGQDLVEMRIPKQRQGGVARVYFCWSPRVKNCAVLLAGEIKHGKAPEMLGVAQARLREYQAGGMK